MCRKNERLKKRYLSTKPKSVTLETGAKEISFFLELLFMSLSASNQFSENKMKIKPKSK